MPDKFSTMSAFLYSPKIGRTTYVCTRLMIYAKEIERVVYFGLKSEEFENSADRDFTYIRRQKNFVKLNFTSFFCQVKFTNSFIALFYFRFRATIFYVSRYDPIS